MAMMLMQNVLDSAGGPPISVHTPVKTGLLGITPTGDPSTFFVMVQDAQLRIQFPVRLPVETAEEGLLLLKDPAKMEPLVSAARQEVLKQIDEQRIRQSLANPGGMPPG